MALAGGGGWGQVLGARLVDRTGKGLRAAPRDALIAQNCPVTQRASLWATHSLETIGEIVGAAAGILVVAHG